MWGGSGYTNWFYTGNEELQVWENVTVLYWQNSSNSPPVFVNGSIDMKAEASQIVDGVGWFSTTGYIGISGGNYNQYGEYYVDPANEGTPPNYYIQVPAPASEWFFAVSNWQTNGNLIGHTLWENVSFYYLSYNEIPLGTSVTVTIT